MTATTVTGSPDVRRALERTWNRLAKPGGEDPLPERWLDELAHAVEVQQPNGGQTDDASVLRGENAKLADLVEARQRDLERLDERHARALGRVAELEGELAQARAAGDGEQYAKALADNLELTARCDTQRDEIAAVVQERDQLRADLAKALKARRPQLEARPVHQHAYPQETPESLPGECECGKAFPRALFDADDDEHEAGAVLSGWDELWEGIRDEIALTGWPSSVDGEASDIDAPTPEPVALEVPAEDATDVVPRRRKQSECGTEAGYHRHRRDDEDACDACKAAIAELSRLRRAARKAREAAEAGEPR